MHAALPRRLRLSDFKAKIPDYLSHFKDAAREDEMAQVDGKGGRNEAWRTFAVVVRDKSVSDTPLIRWASHRARI